MVQGVEEALGGSGCAICAVLEGCPCRQLDCWKTGRGQHIYPCNSLENNLTCTCSINLSNSDSPSDLHKAKSLLRNFRSQMFARALFESSEASYPVAEVSTREATKCLTTVSAMPYLCFPVEELEGVSTECT